MLLHSPMPLSTMPRPSRRAAANKKGGVVDLFSTASVRRCLVSLGLAGTLAAVAGCATPPTEPAARAEFERTNDPLEPMNRTIFDVNMFLDRILIKPVAQGYRTVVPDFAQNAIRNFLHNLGEPVIFANDVMQGEFKSAHDTFARFIINSTFGVGGTIDLAGQTGLPRQTGDFGQTLNRWGSPEGPYLVLPIFGPSNPRDAVGLGVDGVMEPFQYLAGAYGAETTSTIARFAANGIDQRAQNIDTLDDLQRHAIDFYAEIRSLYRQHRASELRHGRPGPMPDLENND
jgi:phospholipid-binding lipoprotein MlaA